MCFNPARSRGFFPSELDLTAIVDASRRDIPSCDWHPARRRDPKVARGRRPSPDPAPIRGIRRCPARPDRSFPAALAGRRSRSRITETPTPDDGSKSVAASLQGFHPAAGWGGAIGFLRRYAVLALLGFLLPGAFSFHCLGLHSRGRRSPLGPRLGPAAASLPAPSPRFPGLRYAPRRSASSQALQEEPPFWVPFPVLQSVKEPWKSAFLFRGSLPLRGFPPRPGRQFQFPERTERVSERLTDPHLQVQLREYRAVGPLSTGVGSTFRFPLRFRAVALARKTEKKNRTGSLQGVGPRPRNAPRRRHAGSRPRAAFASFLQPADAHRCWTSHRFASMNSPLWPGPR